MRVDKRSLEDYGSSYVPSFEPPVIIQKHLPTLLCNGLVAELSKPKAIASGVHDPVTGEAKVDSYHRSSAAVNMPQGIYEDMVTLLTTTVSMHMLRLLGKRAELCEPLQFLKYAAEDRGHFLPHTDNAYYDASGKFQYTFPKRHVSCVAYVNDDYEGGEFVMHSVKDEAGEALRLKPKIGELIIFPSDIRYLHEVTNVTRGVRYSIVGWFSLK